MEKPNKVNCRLGRGCPLHGFNPTVSQLLINKAFDQWLEREYTVEEIVSLRRVDHGQE